MTAQVPERILIHGKPHWLHAEPLYRLLKTRKAKILAPEAWATACRRQYVGTWDVIDGRLWLVGLCTYGDQELPLSDAMRNWFLRLVPTNQFPIRADWFSGSLRIPTGPKLVQGFHGWTSWFSRERVVTCRQGKVIRDREVDTLAMLEWALRRNEGLKQDLDPENTPGGPLAWITDDDYEHLRGDWSSPEAISGTWFARQ